MNPSGAWRLGTNVIIQHDGNIYTLYGHLAKSYVRAGQIVKKGQIIASMGNSGNVVGTTGTHLHFGVFMGIPYQSGSKTSNPLNLYK
jgi:murein DD-endopeptidase MepM/ murein hydrolase activator NlpD